MIPAFFPNPFREKGLWLKGNIHTHTTSSDGALDTHQISTLYHSKGYDFLFITDHGKVTDVNGLSDSFGGELLVIPGVELGIGESAVGTKYHLVGLNLGHLIESDDPQSAIDEIVKEGGEAVIAHPYWSSLTVNDLLKLDGYLGIEIFNTTCHFSVAKGYSVIHWDDLLIRGRSTFGFAVDDAHWHFSAHRPADACCSWIMVKSASLAVESLMNSIRNGLFYSSNGPEIFDVDVDEDSVYVKSSPAKSINFITMNGHGERFTSVSEPMVEAEYKLRGIERYVRIEVEDGRGGTAWTNPIIFTQSSKESSALFSLQLLS